MTSKITTLPIHRHIALIVFAVFLCLLPLSSRSDEAEELIKAVMKGQAVGTDDSAKAEAIEDAKRKIVQSILGNAVAPRYLRALAPLVKRAPRYMNSWNVLDESHEDGKYSVKIEAYAQRRTLLRDAAYLVLQTMRERPKVVLLVEERIGNNVILIGQEETSVSLGEKLRKAGLEVIDTSHLLSNYTARELVAYMRGDTSAAARLARENLADVAIIGTARVVSEQSRPGQGMVTASGKITIKAVRARDAKLRGVRAAEATVRGQTLDQSGPAALRDACAKLWLDTFVDVVIATAELPPMKELIVSIEQPGTPMEFDKFFKRMARDARSGNAEKLRFTSQAAGFRISSDTSMGDVVRFLRSLPYSDEKSLEIVSAAGNEIILRTSSTARSAAD